MATIILRQSNVVTSTGGTVKGSPLTNAEVDNNFANLNVVVNIHESNIGVLANLTTNNKDNVVNSIAELRSNLTSSAGLATLLTDETGSGNFVMNTSPTIQSAVLTGTTQAVTAANGTSNAMVATTAFVNNEINDSPTITSATLTGTTQAVTAANGTSNAMVATTQFVNNEINDSPTITNATLVGTPQAVTAANGTSNAMVATTQFVNNEIRSAPTIEYASLLNPTLVSAFELANVRNEAPPAIVNVDMLDSRGSILFFTSNTTANVTVNFRGNATTTLDAWLGTTASNANVASSVVVLTSGATQFYVNNVLIDGRIMHNSSVKGNLFWQGNTLVTGGTTAALDTYSFTIIKNGGTRGGANYGGNVYTILGSQTNFKSFLA